MDILQFVSNLIWPVALAAGILYFRKDIRDALRRMNEVKWPGGALGFSRSAEPPIPQPGSPDNSMVPAERRLGRKVDSKVKLKWANTGNIYWLGHDLFICYVSFLSGAEKRRLLYDLRQACHHLASLEMTDKGPEEQLHQMIQRIMSMLETDITRAVRQDFARDLLLVRDEVGAHMERHQPDFRPGPQ